jgi:hypothetical protein
MLDKLSPEARHISLLLLGTALTWLVIELPGLDVNPLIASLVGAIATAALAYLTPLTKQYGVGSDTKD